MAGLLTPLSLEPGASMLEAVPCRILCLRPWGSSLLHSSMISEDKTGISRPELILLWSLEKLKGGSLLLSLWIRVVHREGKVIGDFTNDLEGRFAVGTLSIPAGSQQPCPSKSDSMHGAMHPDCGQVVDLGQVIIWVIVKH